MKLTDEHRDILNRAIFGHVSVFITNVPDVIPQNLWQVGIMISDGNKKHHPRCITIDIGSYEEMNEVRSGIRDYLGDPAPERR